MMRKVAMDSSAPEEVLTRNSDSTVEWKSKDFRRWDKDLVGVWLLLLFPFMVMYVMQIACASYFAV